MENVKFLGLFDLEFLEEETRWKVENPKKSLMWGSKPEFEWVLLLFVFFHDCPVGSLTWRIILGIVSG